MMLFRSSALLPDDAPKSERMYDLERTVYRIRLLKILCAVTIAICFWYAVPYTFPLQLDPDPTHAAANEAAAYEGNVSRQIAMPVVFLVSAYMLYRLPKIGRMTGIGRLTGVGLGYVAWSFISIAWSSDPAITLKRLVVFGIDLLFAVTLARVVPMEELALFGFVSTGVVALIALCADVFASHTFAPLDPDYRFMGVMTANYQAMNLFVCLASGLTLAQKHPRILRWLSPWLALLAVLLFLTRARIGTFLLIGASVFIGVRLARQWLQAQGRAVALLAALTVLLPLITFVLGHSGENAVSSVFMMGRHDTENTASLSNRAPLWAELLDSVAEHPMLGCGFEAFWSSERVQKISTDQGWVVPHAHNTYLDQVLSLGIFGCLLYSGMLIGACVLAWRRYGHDSTHVTLFPAILLSWLALLGITESVPVAPYLPTLIAYSCLAKMCMTENAEQENSEMPVLLPNQPGRLLWAGVGSTTRTPSREVRR